MLGLLGILNMGARALQTQQAGVEVTGQNLSNINTPGYARQRLQIQTSLTIPTAIGPEGTGVQAVSIQQIRSSMLDGQITSETSVGGYWNTQQSTLENAQTQLNEFFNQSSSSVDSSATAGSASISQGLSSQLSGLFNAFQSVATDPTSLTSRQALVNQALALTSSFNQASQRLSALHDSVNTSLNSDVKSANQLLSDVADLNKQIAVAEMSTGGTANDLRDLRQQKLESLAGLVNFDATTTATDGSVNISIGGNQLVSGQQVLDTLQTYDAGGGQMLVQTATSATPLTLTGGSIQGNIDARDGTIQTLQTNLDTLASNLITQVNTIYSTGYDLQANTGADFFTGTNAATIGVNAGIQNDPSQVQAAGTIGTPGDNTVALALAQLAQQPMAALNNQTFSDAYALDVSSFGNSLSRANNQVANYNALNTTLLTQRDSVSGVSLEEEMANLMTFEKAYQASAKIITTADQMLQVLINLKT
jgi:flagellar hook-associated protein 1 FlgK